MVHPSSERQSRCELSVKPRSGQDPRFSDGPSQIFNSLQFPGSVLMAAKSKIQIMCIYYHCGQKWKGDGRRGGEV